MMYTPPQTARFVLARILQGTRRKLRRGVRLERRPGAGGPHRGGQRRDVVGAVVAAAVDEERRRAGDAAYVRGVDVLGDAAGARVPSQVLTEALDASIGADPPPPPAPARGPDVSASRPEALAVARSGSHPRRWSLPVVWLGALGTLGAAGLATGGVLALEVRSENDEAASLCPGSTCASVAEKTRHDGLVGDARTQRTLAVASAGIGAAALLAGTYLWWRGGRAPGTVSAAGSLDGRMVLRPGVGLEPGLQRGLAGATLQLGW